MKCEKCPNCGSTLYRYQLLSDPPQPYSACSCGYRKSDEEVDQ